uniref:Ribosomal protein n=1 Tax=Cyanidium sp. THAL103 TaxID=3027999 RepID=A0A9Y1I453_9RHOD|nr:ribosomal protein L1 [Cyanidium sp. THAL103]
MIKKKSKRFIDLSFKIDKKLYDLNESIKLLKTISNAKFDETVEAHFSLNLDPKYANQQLRSTVILPKGSGKKVRVAVVAKGKDLDLAKIAGADICGSEDLVERISNGYLKFDYLIVTPESMPWVAKLGKILGPKGLMPSVKSGTVSSNLDQSIKEFRLGKLEYRVDKTGVVHIPFGKSSFSENDLLINLITVINSIVKNKPNGIKNKFWKTLHIASTMSPSINIDINKLKEGNIK